MATIKALLYCTKSKPYLSKDIVSSGKYVLNDKKDYFNRGDLNGSVCFECDCKEAFCLTMPDITVYYEEYISVNRKPKDPISHDELLVRSRLSNEQLNGYGKGKDLYAYHFENVKSIEPMPTTQLYKDEACTIPLAKAPQSYCFAYRKKYFRPIAYCDIYGDEKTKKAFDENRFDSDGFYEIEKVLVFSIRSPWLCKIANGEKDLEVRKTRISNAGIEYK